MGNLLPAERKHNPNNQGGTPRKNTFGKRPPQARKKREQPAEVGLSKNLTIVLALTVVVLSFAVAFLAFQINNLKTANREKELEITRLTKDIEILTEQNEQETVAATVNYNDVPEKPGPETVEGAENPDVAEIQKFNYEELLAKSSSMIRSSNKVSYYICNDKAALRLIEDSHLEYLISKSNGEYYNVLLFGTYEPDWVTELLKWEERKSQLLSTAVASSTENGTNTALRNFKMPEELNGLEASKQDYVMGIQLLSTTSEEEVSKKIWKLRNEEIPAYIFSYPIKYTNNFRYSLQVDIFPNRKKAVEYQNILKSDLRDFYLEIINVDVTGSYPRELFDYTE